MQRNFERTGALPLYLLKPPHFGSFSNRFQPNFSELVRRSALPRFQPELPKSLPPLSPIFPDQSGHTPTGATRADTRGPDHQSRHAPTSAPERTHAHQGTEAATRPPAHQSGHTPARAPKPPRAHQRTRADTRGPGHQSRHAPTSAPERTRAHQGTKAATRPPAHQSGHTPTRAPKPPRAHQRTRADTRGPRHQSLMPRNAEFCNGMVFGYWS